MSSSESSGNLNATSDEAREDLLATLAAARELNPDMDKALADQYLARRQEDQKRTAQRSPMTMEQPQPPAQATRRWRGPFIPVFALVMLAVILAVGVHWGTTWWLLFWIPFMFGGFWWRRGWSNYDTEGGAGDPHYQRHMARQRYRQERLAARYGYRTGYSPNADDGSTAARQPDLPAPTSTPPGPGTAPLPTTPSTSPAPLSQAGGTPGPFAGGLPPANPAG